MLINTTADGKRENEKAEKEIWEEDHNENRSWEEERSWEDGQIEAGGGKGHGYTEHMKLADDRKKI